MNKNRLKLLGLSALYVLAVSTLVTAIPDMMAVVTHNEVLITSVHIIGYIAYLVGCAFLGAYIQRRWKD